MAYRLGAEAAEHLQEPGRRAMDRGDTAAAVNLLERAEALVPPHQINLTLQESLIHGLAMSGRLDEAVARAARTAVNCSTAGDRIGELRARLLESIWGAGIDPMGYFGQLCALVQEGRPVIEHSGDPAAATVLDYAAAEIEHNRSQLGAAFAAFTRAMKHARKAGGLWLESYMRGYAASCIRASSCA